ncbi:NAD(+) diphosphatase [Salinicola rhizosphaerae]|uniref:NAD(+) diphosphatase n=1 Tax=Salinicola rhizosphaerae TaxID=1443141 RepID=A0ABQ3DP12_9GAMM|nr:NAD(+) diphosphatase [Salinicola rhizosphaerae]GHB08802.1 NADH pyrophosphatase [Salinicola rhizosphaerae]
MLRREMPPATVSGGWLLRLDSAGGVAPADDDGAMLSRVDPWPESAMRLGYWSEVPVAVSVEEGQEWPPAREWLAQVSSAESELIATALQVTRWARDHRFCGRCGHAMRRLGHEFAMHCDHCGLRSYPRISPCIITLVTHGKDMLLARSPRFPPQRYSTLAGFIEPGEAVEAAVRREVMEEVGVDVGRVSFFKSQSWPFPHSLMMGFFAEAASRRIRIDGEEIVDAAWFSPDNLPQLPPVYSISRQLIETHRGAVAVR